MPKKKSANPVSSNQANIVTTPTPGRNSGKEARTIGIPDEVSVADHQLEIQIARDICSVRRAITKLLHFIRTKFNAGPPLVQGSDSHGLAVASLRMMAHRLNECLTKLPQITNENGIPRDLPVSLQSGLILNPGHLAEYLRAIEFLRPATANLIETSAETTEIPAQSIAHFEASLNLLEFAEEIGNVEHVQQAGEAEEATSNNNGQNVFANGKAVRNDSPSLEELEEARKLFRANPKLKQEEVKRKLHVGGSKASAIMAQMRVEELSCSKPRTKPHK